MWVPETYRGRQFSSRDELQRQGACRLNSASHAKACIEKGDEKIGDVVMASRAMHDRSAGRVNAHEGMPRVTVIFVAEGGTGQLLRSSEGMGARAMAQTEADRNTSGAVVHRAADSHREPSVHSWLALGPGAAIEPSAVFL